MAVMMWRLTTVFLLVFILLLIGSREIAQAFKIRGSQLIFEGEASNLYLFDLQTGYTIKLIHDIEGVILPHTMQSVDGGQKVGFLLRSPLSKEPGLAGEVYTFDLDTHTLTPMHIGEPIKSDVRWSPDGHKIAFVDRDGRNVFLADHDGSNIRRLIDASVRFSSLAWSPDSQTIATSIFTDSQHQLALIDVETGKVTLLDVTAEVAMLPVWSPDGKKIALARFLSKRSNVYTYNLETDKLKRLTFPPHDAVFPVWSRDGEKIAFITLDWANGSNPNGDVWIIHADGSQLEAITTTNAYRSLALWAPDGQWIAYNEANGYNDEKLYLQPAFNLQIPPLKVAELRGWFLWR